MKAWIRYWMTCCSLFAITLTMFLSFGAITKTTSFEPDHYVSYEIKTTPFFNERIMLKDQFIDWTEFLVIKPEKLLNPAKKQHNGRMHEIKNKELHYTAYKIRPLHTITINPGVHISNQFGEFDIQEFRPDQLLVPSSKVDLLRVKDQLQVFNADHYLCYKIDSQTTTLQLGHIQDQFRGRDFAIIKATRFCNPVAKKHDNREFGIINDVPSNHLMCFEIKEKSILRIVALLNQFGIQGAFALKDDEICVPSVKTRLPQPCQDDTPNGDGICQGICENPEYTCQASTDGLSCSCLPPLPVLCGDQGPDENGLCHGLCENQEDCCQMSADGTHCECAPPLPDLCGDIAPDGNGMCKGICEDPEESCLPGPGGILCACIPNEMTLDRSLI